MSMEKEKILLKKERRPEIYILYTCKKSTFMPFLQRYLFINIYFYYLYMQTEEKLHIDH